MQPEGIEVPVLGFAGWSGAGKTTLLAQVIPQLRQARVRIALVKHAHHRFDVDHPGKDSHRLRSAGADQVLLTGARRYALMVERTVEKDPVLEEELPRIDCSACDVILVEGFRDARIAKIEVHRPALGRPTLHQQDPCIIAVATDALAELDTQLPRLALNNPQEVASFILGLLNIPHRENSMDAK
ncbi:molybdopterin-guanine dinucleotide biosynthesis protein B [Natronocella acetinitrilica]|uniref:molybdopterin-guanine dinucleotide biosynthesis protein B n=1 Tax=Natronocella acetinitrilica TaxID=414046 RepID=UPI003F4FCA91